MSANATAPLIVKRGVCHVVYAYDIGVWIDLEESKRIVSASAAEGKVQNPRVPKYFDYNPPPLRILQQIPPLHVGRHEVSSAMDVVLYDFGGVTVTYEIPFKGPLTDLRQLSHELSESDVLLEDSRQQVEDLLEAIRPAVIRPSVANLAEDYVIYHAEEFTSPCPVNELHACYGQEIAQILRVEKQELSEQEIADAVSVRISFATDDITLIDWYGAMVFDKEAEDVCAVLEFANVELLEMRFLDRQLDDSLDRAYEVSLKRQRLLNFVPGLGGASLRRVSQMQVDGAILFERVSNALKLVGDQYLARVYRLAAQRFHLSEWSTSALRKLEAIQNIYKQMHERAASWRLEALEWIIIVLIAFEIVMAFLPKSFFPQ